MMIRTGYPEVTIPPVGFRGGMRGLGTNPVTSPGTIVSAVPALATQFLLNTCSSWQYYINPECWGYSPDDWKLWAQQSTSSPKLVTPAPEVPISTQATPTTRVVYGPTPCQLGTGTCDPIDQALQAGAATAAEKNLEVAREQATVPSSGSGTTSGGGGITNPFKITIPTWIWVALGAGGIILLRKATQ